ncbi:MAG: DUF6265 family protein [Polyangiaceae bacterium]
MWKVVLGAVLVAGCCPSSGPSVADGSTVAETSLPAVAWLAGTWVTDDGQTEEHWSPPRGGMMLGYGRTVVNGRGQHYEHLRIDEQAGVLRYHAFPAGQALTTFALVSQEGGRLVFENPDHDYPQRIIYRRLDAGRLEVRIEGVDQGESKHSEWAMRRVLE